MRIHFKNTENIVKFISDEKYLDMDSDSLDFCLGKNLQEAGEVCREILKKQGICLQIQEA